MPRWRTPVSKLQSALKIAPFYIALLVAWQLVVGANIVPDYIFPSPLEVLRRLTELSRDGLLWPSISMTLCRMLLGYGLSAFGGILIGLAMGTIPPINDSFRSLFLGLQTLPSAAWAPIALMIFGLSDSAIIFVIVLSSIPAVSIATSDAVRQIPTMYIHAAQTLGTGRLAMVWRIIIPASLPRIVTGIKLGWTLAWHGTVSAELIKSSVGLGGLLHMGRELSDASQVIAIMLITIAIGLIFDYFIFGTLDKRIRQRWGLVT